MGDCFGKEQPVILQLLEIPPGMQRLEGVRMELRDSAFPLVHDIVCTDDANVAFQGADAIFLVGSRPRTKDMDRSDLVVTMVQYSSARKAIDEVASKNVKVITVGNPVIRMHLLPMQIPQAFLETIYCTTRLHQNRAVGQMAERSGVPASKIHDVFIWGNHANTMYPDPRFATVDGRRATDVFDSDWLESVVFRHCCYKGQSRNCR